MQPAFLVEGDQEKAIIESICENYTVRGFRTNGENVKLKTIANVLDRQLKINLYNRYYPIIILFDRETRDESAKSIIEEINSHLTDLNYNVNQFIIGVPNRKFENWILPFVDMNGEFTDVPSNSFEGKNCIGELKKRLGRQKKTYDKVEFGPRIFRQINPESLATASDSFKSFFNDIKKNISKDILNQCWWLNK